MNLPLGLALTEVIAETGIPTICHHPDFFWERKRFLSNAVWDYLAMVFPSNLPSFQHVVINSVADDNQISLRILVNNYSVYATDIKPKGFEVIELDDYVDSRAVKFTKKVLKSASLAKEMVDHNYELGKRYYSYSFLRRKLKILLSDYFGV